MPLASRRFGETGPAVLILPGLFGSSRNWQGMARRLQDRYRVHAVDLRNHGNSPHAETMTYPAMAADVATLQDELGLDRAIVVGHSMGGKVAMWLALHRPERVERLVVVDIAPVPYPDRYTPYIDAMLALPLATLSSRQEADHRLTAAIPDTVVRQFLLHNLVNEGGAFRWRVNLEVIRRNMAAIMGFPAPPAGHRYPGFATFLRGEQSLAITPRHHPAIAALFPEHRIATVPGAGHWPHTEQPEAFLDRLNAALAG